MTERLKHGTIDEEAEACLGLRCMRAETEAQVCHPEAALSPSHLLIFSSNIGDAKLRSL